MKKFDDFNIKFSKKEEKHYYNYFFSNEEYEFVFTISNLPVENEHTLLDFNQYFNILQKGMTENIENFFKKMPYDVFLISNYWKIVSNYKKKISDNKCQLCNSKKYLNTHHNNYKNKGKEYKKLNDLVILCNKCHKKFHDK